jgi:hypothetical protein
MAACAVEEKKRLDREETRSFEQSLLGWLDDAYVFVWPAADGSQSAVAAG